MRRDAAGHHHPRSERERSAAGWLGLALRLRFHRGIRLIFLDILLEGLDALSPLN